MTPPDRRDGPSPLRQLVLLSADPADAVTRALRARQAELPWPLLEIDAPRLPHAVEFGARWRFEGRWIDPAQTALVNRLPMADRLDPGAPTGPDDDAAAGRQGVWTRLRAELGRCAYVSSLPTPTSLIGGFGSLADLWADLPRRLPGLRVPVHSTPAAPRPLAGGAVHAVNRWALYQLGRPLGEALAAGDLPEALRLDYERPPGRLATLAQVGGTLMFANPPPEMSRTQADAIVAFARRLAVDSPQRILEHVFFLAGDEPVLYSSCPVPALSGAHAAYPQLLIQGLRDDIGRRARLAGR